MQKYKCSPKPHKATWRRDLHRRFCHKEPFWVGVSRSSKAKGLYTKTVILTVTSLSLTMELVVFIHAVQWLSSQSDTWITHAIIFTLSEPAANSAVRFGLPWLTRSKDCCGSTALLSMPDSEAMNCQTDRQEQQTAQLVSSLAGERGLEDFKTFENRETRAPQYWSPEGKSRWERMWPTFHPPRPGTVCVQRHHYWYCLEGNAGSRDWAKRVWPFPSATTPSSAETGNCARSPVTYIDQSLIK